MTAFVICVCSFYLGRLIGYETGERVVKQQAIERGYAYNRFIMAGVHDHFEFRWNNDKFYPKGQN